MLIDSMSQDILIRQKKKSELDSLNGYLLELAEKTGIKVPYNQTVHDLCKKQFALEEFTPLSVDFIWEEIEKHKNK